MLRSARPGIELNDTQQSALQSIVAQESNTELDFIEDYRRRAS